MDPVNEKPFLKHTDNTSSLIAERLERGNNHLSLSTIDIAKRYCNADLNIAIEFDAPRRPDQNSVVFVQNLGSRNTKS